MLKSVREIINSEASTYQGSEKTRSMIEEQIVARWGKAEVKNYDPFHSARTFNSWVKLGFRVKKGEKALRSVTVIETKDADGEVLKKVVRPCFIFYYRQVEKMGKEKAI
jgi:hypothetical protein